VFTVTKRKRVTYLYLTKTKNTPNTGRTCPRVIAGAVRRHLEVRIWFTISGHGSQGGLDANGRTLAVTWKGGSYCVVSTLTGLPAGRPRFRGSIAAGTGKFSLFQNFQTRSGAQPASRSLDMRAVSPGVKLPGREPDHCPSSIVEVNGWSYFSAPPYALMACTGTNVPLASAHKENVHNCVLHKI